MHGRGISLILAFSLLPAYPAPAEAQTPRRVLGPLAAPLGMMLRALPRPHHRASRHYRPRAVHRRPLPDRVVPAVERRRQYEPSLQLAQAATAFWPIAAPDAFEGMLGYALWPREYGQQFWSHGPRDIIQAMTAPTAAFAAASVDDGAPRLPRLAGDVNVGESERAICVARVQEHVMRPLDRVAERIDLNAEQRQKLDHLRATVRSAIEAETAACRNDIPSTQPERLRAMIDGLWAMRYAEFRIRPALAAFHDSLSDAQKAQLAAAPQTVGGSATTEAPGPATVCAEAVTARSNPFESIARALRPSDGQGKSLQMLYGASMEMAKFLTSTCPAETPATPMARFDAAGDRLMTLLHAAMGIEPVLGDFYSRLSDEQRQRFNTVAR